MKREQWEQLPLLDGKSHFGGLMPGDVMMKQIYHFEMTGAFITAGQAVGKAIRLTTFKGFTSDTMNEHAAVMIDQTNMVESIGPGVTMGAANSGIHQATPYVVFRCNNRELAQEAADLAKGFMGYGKRFNTDRKAGMIDPGKYNLAAGTKAIFNPFGKRNGAAAAPVTDQMRDFISGRSNVRPNMYCTQFVSAIYVLAADFNALPSRTRDAALNIDPGKMIPIVYADCLQKSNLFFIAGRYGNAPH